MFTSVFSFCSTLKKFLHFQSWLTLFVSAYSFLFIFSSALNAATQNQLIAPADINTGQRFGQQVSVSQNFLAISSSTDNTPVNDSGSVYLFQQSGNQWTQHSKIIEPVATQNNLFGWDISLQNTFLAISALQGDAIAADAGAVYLYQFDGGTNWNALPVIAPADINTGDQFGWSLDISGNRLIVGAKQNDSAAIDAGAAYIFEYIGGNWIQTAKLVASNAAANDWFGYDVAIHNNRAVVSALLANANGNNSGAIYIFDFDGTNWNESQLLPSDAHAEQRFGHALSLEAGRLLAGVKQDSDNGVRAGAAYLFEYQSGNWIEQKITPTDGSAEDSFGRSVALSGNRAVIGAFSDDDTANRAGSIYLFERNTSGNWFSVDKLVADTPGADSWLGYSVDIDAQNIISGATLSNNPTLSGRAYYYSLATVTDTDGDGLSDDIEIALGTQINDTDSDNDGVSDFDEVNRDGDPTTYTLGIDTDPNNNDTDGDGLLDGVDPSPLGAGTKVVPLPWPALFILAGILLITGMRKSIGTAMTT